MREDFERLRAFACDILDNLPDGGIEGDDLQDLGVKHGLLVPTEVKEPCGENCYCAEYGDFPMTCYRKSILLLK